MPVPQVQLSESQIDEIAAKAAEKAIAKMTAQLYQEVGKTVVKKFFWIVGLLSVGAIAGWQATQRIFN